MSEPTYKPLDLSKYEGHTPGPWTLGDENNNCCDIKCGETTISLDRSDNMSGVPSISREEMLSNAHLVMAAPALLTDAREARKVIASLAFALEIARGRILAEDDECNLSYSYHTVTHALSLAAPWVERA